MHISSALTGPNHGLQLQQHSSSLPKIIHYIHNSYISDKNI